MTTNPARTHLDTTRLLQYRQIRMLKYLENKKHLHQELDEECEPNHGRKSHNQNTKLHLRLASLNFRNGIAEIQSVAQKQCQNDVDRMKAQLEGREHLQREIRLLEDHLTTFKAPGEEQFALQTPPQTPDSQTSKDSRVSISLTKEPESPQMVCSRAIDSIDDPFTSDH